MQFCALYCFNFVDCCECFVFFLRKNSSSLILYIPVMEVDIPETDVNLKKIRCQQNVLKNPDGSADYSEGDTNVMVAVYGPADCRESRQMINKCYIEVSFRPKTGIPGVAEKFLEHTIRSVCETVILTNLHPRSQIMIVVQIVQDHGSLLSCAINAVSMALQDAGISMRCMPAAISMAITKRERERIRHPGEVDDREEEVVISPSTSEEQDASASMLFVFDSVRKNTVCTVSRGTIDTLTYKRCLIAARSVSETVFKFYRDLVTKHVTESEEFT